MKGIRHQKKRLADGKVVEYGYYGRNGGYTPLGIKGSPEYHENLAAILRSEPAPGTFTNLIAQYKQSKRFLKLAPRTQRDYLQQLDKVQAKFGKLSYRALQSRSLLPYLHDWLEEGEGSPKQANYAMTVLKLVLAWSVSRGLIETNVAMGVPKLDEGDRSDKCWLPEQVTAFLDKADDSMKLALILALETGQRQGDLLSLPWHAWKNNRVGLTQSKGGVYVNVPVTQHLHNRLSALRPTAVTILTNGAGHSWDPDGHAFRHAWRTACADAGITGVTFHDLRGTFVTIGFAKKWSREDIALCTGHSMRNLGMLDVYLNRQAVAAWEGHLALTGNEICKLPVNCEASSLSKTLQNMEA